MIESVIERGKGVAPTERAESQISGYKYITSIRTIELIWKLKQLTGGTDLQELILEAVLQT